MVGGDWVGLDGVVLRRGCGVWQAERKRMEKEAEEKRLAEFKVFQLRDPAVAALDDAEEEEMEQEEAGEQEAEGGQEGEEEEEDDEEEEDEDADKEAQVRAREGTEASCCWCS